MLLVALSIPVMASPAGALVELSCDFDADNFPDLAIGVPGEDIGPTMDAGMVHVFYGGVGGLPFGGTQTLHQNTPGIGGTAEASDTFGQVVMCGDFDGDTYFDLAIGVPGESIGIESAAGMVHVVYGSDTGLDPADSQTWHQGTPGIVGAAEALDLFGSALDAGDYNGDGFDDLAIGVTGEDDGATPDVGSVHVLYGSASGLTAAGSQVWRQDTPGVPGAEEAGDAFGNVLTHGDFDMDGHDDLAIGTAFEDLGEVVDAGMVTILPGSETGLTTVGAMSIHQNTAGIPGVAETEDLFGDYLAAGDFDADGFFDLAIGVPEEDLGATSNAGMVHVIHGSLSGLDPSDNQSWHQDTSGVIGTAEAGDRFGATLESSDFNGDSVFDLAIGVPDEAIGAIAGAGAVNVLYGSGGTGLGPAGNQFISQNTSGVPGTAETDDGFADQLVAGDYSSDGAFDLVVGVAGEALGAITGGGMIQVIDGIVIGGLIPASTANFHQNTPGIAGTAEIGDGFGVLADPFYGS